MVTLRNTGFLLTFLPAMFASAALANESQPDAREQCRAHVSGTYLSFMNDLDLLKGNLTSTTESTLGMKAKVKLSAKQITQLEARNEELKIPAADLDENLLGLHYELDSFKIEIKDAEVRIIDIKDQIAKKEKEFRTFKDQVKSVFETVHSKVTRPGAYPLKLEYRHSCSKFQQLCPLPPVQAAALLSLVPGLSDKLPCERYANMHKSQP